MTELYGILGYPVAHSRSPALHGAAFAALGIDAAYVRFETLPERLPDAIRGLLALGVRGANVTIPHKESVLALLDEVTPDARAIGAVNTIVRRDDRLCGHNTDAPGLARSLLEAGVALSGARCVVLGAGGAARAAVVGLAQHGAATIGVAARRLAQSEALVRELRGACPDASLAALAFSQPELRAALADASILIQATSASLASAADPQGFAAGLGLEALPAGASVVDLVYTPRETAVLAKARALGLHAVDGTGMLLHQGALAFELWTGRAAPIDAMRGALGLA